MTNDKFIPFGDLPIDRKLPKLSWTPKKNVEIENPNLTSNSATKPEETKPELVFEPDEAKLSSPNKLAAEKAVKDLQVNLLIAYLTEIGQTELAESLENSKNLLTGDNRTNSKNFPEYFSMFKTFVQESKQILWAERAMVRLDLDQIINDLKKSGDREQKALADCLDKMRGALKKNILSNKEFNPTTAVENLLALKKEAICLNRRAAGIKSFVAEKLPKLAKKEIKDRLNAQSRNLLQLVKSAKKLARRGTLDIDLSQAKFIAEKFQAYFSFGSQVFRFAKAVNDAPKEHSNDIAASIESAFDALTGKRTDIEGNLAFLEDYIKPEENTYTKEKTE